MLFGFYQKKRERESLQCFNLKEPLVEHLISKCVASRPKF